LKPTTKPKQHTQPKPTVPKRPLLEILLSDFGPISVAATKAYDGYIHYRDQGKAAVFLMTLAGIIAMTFGFGYLLQYSFNHLMSDVVKVILGFALGVAIAGAGIWLTLKRPQFSEYASSLIGLGVMLSYLTSYFTGTYYQLVDATASFVCLGVITTIAYGLALRFETKIVSVLALLGGLFAPLIINLNATINTVFVSYLLLLCAANLHLARKIQWRKLAELTFVLSLGIIEYSHYGQSGSLVSVLLLLSFFYLYAYYWSFDGLALRTTVDKTLISLLTANLFYLLYALLTLPASTTVSDSLIGVIFIINAALIGGAFVRFKVRSSPLSALYFVMISLFVACAIFVLLPINAKGLLWGIEGLLLIYVGFIFKNGPIRIEGYSIYLLALLSLLGLSLLGLSVDANQLSGPWDWFRLVSIGALFFAGAKLLDTYKSQHHIIEHRTQQLLKACFTLWLVVMWFALVWSFAPAYWKISAIVPLVLLLLHGLKFELRFNIVLVWLHLLFFVGQIFEGITEVGSYRFGQQTLVSQIAWIELFVCGWGIEFIYQKVAHNGPFSSLAKNARLLVYLLIPLMFLPKVWRHFEMFLPAALWLSTTIAWLLHKRVKHPLLLKEMTALYFLSIVTTILAMFSNSLYSNTTTIASYAAVGASVIFIGAMIWLEKPYIRSELVQSCYRNRFTNSLYYLAFCLFAGVSLMMGNTKGGLLAASVYLLFLVYRTPTFAVMRSQLIVSYYLAFALLSLLIYLGFSTGNKAIEVTIQTFIAVLLLAFMTHQNHRTNRVIFRRQANQQTRLWSFHLLTIAGYLAIIQNLFGSPFAVASTLLLVIHAMLILFLTLDKRYQQLTKLSALLFGLTAVKVIFYDMNDYSMVHKVIALMGIGVILLLGAYRFQKLKGDV
ncbi:MAG: putative membrane protein, partial [Phenylobacterium sp.]